MEYEVVDHYSSPCRPHRIPLLEERQKEGDANHVQRASTAASVDFPEADGPHQVW